ncbi:MAG: asparagine synthase (glutamine-hydrolyzing), partial [Alphaproteobacteria bacterium]|nr:asparagine synthase (glutamine-hydrolyzing) [Alphaproteobacteria bacterium]
MCGIFFSIGFENLPSEVIDSVAHRGPDGRGWNEFTSEQGPVVMAHRRLAIVDLSPDGHQPMASLDQRYWVTYNGEIYNYLEIREELKAAGYDFKTQTDTEVLLKSYIHWGPACLDQFNGMFAFVIWDDLEKKAFAARDRFGVKPLYYYRQGDKIAFASEIKQFKHLPSWRAVLNQEMAAFYTAQGYCDHQHETLYENVFQILPGHFAEINSSSLTMNISQWYNIQDHIHELHLSDLEACERFKELFADAIKLRLPSDVSVGACLSGGLDSSSIVSMMRLGNSDEKFSTFSAVFPGHRVDESTYIDLLTDRKKITNHKNYPTHDEFTKSLDAILYFHDLPFSGTSIFAQWMTFQSAKAHHVKVILDGQGADESLLGYPSMLNGIIFDYAKSLRLNDLMSFLKWQTNFNNQDLKTTIVLGLQQRFFNLYKTLLLLTNRKTDQNLPSIKSITDMCVYHFSNNLQTLLRYEDRNSMASSIESRLPFLDYRLVEFILSLPINQRF